MTHKKLSTRLASTLVLLLTLLLVPAITAAQDEPEFTSTFDRSRCTFTTTTSHPYLPLWPGYSLLLEGEDEDDEGDLVELMVRMTVLPDTELVDGVLTRVVEEREYEDEELVEVSRNFYAVCRETGDVWYFGEDVDDFEDGEIVGHGGAWRAGMNGAEPGIIMPGSPLVGARYFQETAPGVALDRGEIVSVDEEATVPVGTFENVLLILDSNALEPDDEPDEKLYAPGVGQITDEELELVEIELPPCLPDDTTLCLNDGRFEIHAEWADAAGNEGPGTALLPSGDSGEFWFFGPDNTELLVKVIDACDLTGFNSFWFFAAGLTDVEVTITVTDTESGQIREYDNDLGTPFEPILDTDAFATCP